MRGDTPSPSVTSVQTCLPTSALSLEADFNRGLLPTRRPTSAPSLERRNIAMELVMARARACAPVTGVVSDD